MSTILRLGKVLRAREFSKTLARRTFRSMVNRLTTNPRRLPPTHVRSRRPRRGPLRRRGPCPLARPERYADLHPRRGLAKRSALNSDRRALARPPALDARTPTHSRTHALTHSRTHVLTTRASLVRQATSSTATSSWTCRRSGTPADASACRGTSARTPPPFSIGSITPGSRRRPGRSPSARSRFEVSDLRCRRSESDRRSENSLDFP